MAESKFEKDLEKLEKIVEALEDGELPLDESLKRFEEGIRIGRRCEKDLSEAEKKIEVLLKNADGKLEAQPFGDETSVPELKNEAKSEGENSGDDEEGLLF